MCAPARRGSSPVQRLTLSKTMNETHFFCLLLLLLLQGHHFLPGPTGCAGQVRAGCRGISAGAEHQRGMAAGGGWHRLGLPAPSLMPSIPASTPAPSYLPLLAATPPALRLTGNSTQCCSPMAA